MLYPRQPGEIPNCIDRSAGACLRGSAKGGDAPGKRKLSASLREVLIPHPIRPANAARATRPRNAVAKLARWPVFRATHDIAPLCYMTNFPNRQSVACSTDLETQTPISPNHNPHALSLKTLDQEFKPFARRFALVGEEAVRLGTPSHIFHVFYQNLHCGEADFQQCCVTLI